MGGGLTGAHFFAYAVLSVVELRRGGGRDGGEVANDHSFTFHDVYAKPQISRLSVGPNTVA